MKKVTIALRINNRRYLQKQCAKCGKTLNLGETVYRTARKYLCGECGEKLKFNWR